MNFKNVPDNYWNRINKTRAQNKQDGNKQRPQEIPAPRLSFE